MNNKKLVRLEKAVLANTSRPDEAEMKEIKVRKRIMTSLKLEGDSKMGMILFVGMAMSSLAHTIEEIMDYLGLEFREEYDHKLHEYMRYMNHPDDEDDTRKRFLNKIKLINNHLILPTKN